MFHLIIVEIGIYARDAESISISAHTVDYEFGQAP